MTTITRRYHFESAHWLPGVPTTHKCHRLHGHNYELEITLEGEPDSQTGFVMDFWDLDELVMPWISIIDHRTLNDVKGLENPTAEHIAAWFLDKMRSHGAVHIRIYETKDCWADVQV
jgi:6-pyruvoyltetrahydropterin/6-carboxytetrahydropterin synthase